MAFSLDVLKGFPFVKPTGNTYTFIVCLFIAIIFWLLNALNKPYTTQIQFPLGIEKIPANKILVNQAPNSILVEVSGFGFDLLTFGKVASDSIKLNAQKLGVNNQPVKQTLLVSSQKIYEQITGNLGGNYTLKQVLLDSLILQFDVKISSIVPVNPDLKVETANQFTVEKIQANPNFIELTGPKTILDGIKEIKTYYKVFNKLDQNLTFDLPLVLPANIQSSIKKTEVKIFIERITEGELKLPIEIRNNSDSLKLVMVPNSVSIKYVAPVSKFNQVSKLDFLAFVDFTDLNEENKRVKIEIESINPLAKMISFEPSFAEFIILEK